MFGYDSTIEILFSVMDQLKLILNIKRQLGLFGEMSKRRGVGYVAIVFA